MKELVVTYVPYVLSAITVYMMFMLGDKNPNGWLLGLANQVLWLVWIVISATWGLLPLNAAMWVTCWRNYCKWVIEKTPHVRVEKGVGIMAKDQKSDKATKEAVNKATKGPTPAQKPPAQTPPWPKKGK